MPYLSSINWLDYFSNRFAVPTRLYFCNATAGYDPATERGAWDTTSIYVPIKLSSVPGGAAATLANTEANATNNYDMMSLKAVSDPLPADIAIAGTVSWIIGSLESSTSQNAFRHIHIYVTTGDSDTLRGTLLTDSIGSTEFPTTAAGEGETAVALSSVTAYKGDRIVVEVGVRNVNTSTTSFTATTHYGNTGTLELTSGDTNVTTRPGWIYFSQPLGL